MMSLRALLTGVVDYAGLFPPAQLDMASAVRNYATYRSGEFSWALGRFIVPVSRLNEFACTIADIPDSATEPWRLSALAGPKIDEDVTAISDFNQRNKAASIIDSVELKAATVEEIEDVMNAFPSSLTRFVEIPIEQDPTELVRAIGRLGLRAKTRTGGMVADAFPSGAALARFIYVCTAAHVSFKLTAGLHHPLRGMYRLTYEPDSQRGMMYGFLNLLVATGIAQSGGSIADITAALQETSVSAFRVGAGEISWHGYRIDNAQISSLRSDLVTSFGSCSFTEPIDDLKSLKLL